MLDGPGDECKSHVTVCLWIALTTYWSLPGTYHILGSQYIAVMIILHKKTVRHTGECKILYMCDISTISCCIIQGFIDIELVWWATNIRQPLSWRTFAVSNVGVLESLISSRPGNADQALHVRVANQIRGRSLCLVVKLYWIGLVNSSPPGQNGRLFTDDTFRCISGMKSFVFWLKFHWSLFLSVQLTITQHWLR